MNNKPFRVGLFIDGYTFRKVNDYYLYFHRAKSRIHLGSLQQFILYQVRPLCPKNRSIVIEGHYYHMRSEAKNGEFTGSNLQTFENCLQKNGLQVHYPSTYVNFAKRGNADLINDLSMFSLFQEIDVAVLVSTQGFYAGTVKKLKERNIPVFLFGWEFKYPKADNLIHWKTDLQLKEHAAKYFPMEKIMDDLEGNKRVQDLFVSKRKIVKNLYQKTNTE